MSEISYPLLQAHRGVEAECPENTISAVKAAIKQGYRYIELDPEYTADGKVVLLHDKTVNRTARYDNGELIASPVCIRDISYKNALNYDFGIGFAMRFKGERIALLSDALALARAAGVKVKLDGKISGFSGVYEDALYAIIKEYEDCVAITSTDACRIRFYAAKFPRAELHYDGAVDEEILLSLRDLGDRLTVWLPYKSKRTSWVKLPFADEKTASLVKKYARLGIWIISERSDFEDALRRFLPDIVETDGRIKPIMREGEVYDMHTHSNNSHDSEAEMRENAEVALGNRLFGFAVTDHFDTEYYGREDIVGYVDGSFREASELSSEYEGRLKILKGVEIGEGIWNEAVAELIVNRHPFDVVLGSVHAVRYKELTIPFSLIDFTDISDEDVSAFLDKYFDELLLLLDRIPLDIVTHITVPVRYIGDKYKKTFDIKNYEKKIEKILKIMVDRALALEVNTSREEDYMPDAWIIKKYRDMGGYLVTLASDAHASRRVANGFDKALEFLKSLGFENIYYYEERIAVQCKIK